MSDPLVKIAAFDDSLRAHFTKTLLEDADIFVQVRDEYLVQTDPLLANAVGGIKLFVFTSQLHRAREILADERDGSLEGEMPDAESGLRCPECGDRTIQFGRAFYVWLAAVVLVFGLGLAGLGGDSPLHAYHLQLIGLAHIVGFVGFWVAVLRRFPLACSACGHTAMRAEFEPTYDELDLASDADPQNDL